MAAPTAGHGRFIQRKVMQVEGKWLGGRYQILQRAGGGGMAVVYKAMDTALGRHVAVKVMNDSLSHDEDFIRRFEREAHAAGSLSHSNVVQVFDVGREGNTHYIVMEYIEGASLMDQIEERGRIPAEEAAYIVAQVCDGLAHAHKKGIVHRDLKPHNVMYTLDGQYKLADFGISRTTRSSTITKTGSVMGSVHYFSPEQAQGKPVSVRSDLYSLGVTLYEMVTGQLPFDGEEAVAIALKHLQEPVPDPRSIVPDLPESLCAVIFKAMEKKPEHRFQSAQEMGEALRQLTIMGAEAPRQGEPQAWTPRDEPPSQMNSERVPQQQSRTTRITQSRQTRKKGKKKRWMGLAMAIALLSFLSYGIFFSGLFDTSDGQADAETTGTPTQDEKSKATVDSKESESEKEMSDKEDSPADTSPGASSSKTEEEEEAEDSQEDGGHDWKGMDWEKGDPHFKNISSNGSEGEYHVTLETDLSPEFYYDIILHDSNGKRRQVITRVAVPTPGDGSDYEDIDFKVDVTDDISNEGLVKIRLYDEGESQAYKVLDTLP